MLQEDKQWGEAGDALPVLRHASFAAQPSRLSYRRKRSSQCRCQHPPQEQRNAFAAAKGTGAGEGEEERDVEAAVIEKVESASEKVAAYRWRSAVRQVGRRAPPRRHPRQQGAPRQPRRSSPRPRASVAGAGERHTRPAHPTLVHPARRAVRAYNSCRAQGLLREAIPECEGNKAQRKRCRHRHPALPNLAQARAAACRQQSRRSARRSPMPQKTASREYETYRLV